MKLCKIDSITFILISFAILQYAALSSSQQPNPKPFPFYKFEEKTDQSSFHFTNFSSIDQGALQLTPDSENTDYGFTNKSGRIMYYKPYNLWLSDIDDKIASFNTTFVINIFRQKEWRSGEGFAFLIAPNFDIPQNSHGQWLGLTNATIDGDNNNHIVAIEFDTEKQQEFDPDDNHLGLNVNSVKSKKTVRLRDFGFEISPENVTYYIVWIQYNGMSKVIEVYMKINRNDNKTRTLLLKENIDLKKYVKKESYFGFSASTGNTAIQLNCVLEWDLQVEILEPKRDWTSLKIGLGIGVPGLLLLFLIGVKFGVVYLDKRRTRDDEENVLGIVLKRLPGMPREFKYKELNKATNNFHASMVLGQGGFGIVYKGVLHLDEDSNNSDARITKTEVAVKKFSRDNIKSKDDFLAELTIIHRLRHKHLVQLVGWCYEKGKLLLVYDFMPNGSLEKHLYECSNENILSWRYRCKILAGVASALHYLHNEYDQKVVHRDLKSSNILLDLDYNARLGDFGLARAIENERNSYAELGVCGVQGTMGYVAPECFHMGKATRESDVFGFGAVILEVVCGRSAGIKIQQEEHQYTLVDWVWMLRRGGHIEEAVDERIKDNCVIEEAKRLLFLGLACSHPVASERPQTEAICQIISGTLPAPMVPPFKPVFTWPLLGTAAFSSIDTTYSNMSASSST